MLFAVLVLTGLSATDLFAQKGGKGRYRKVLVKKDVRKNGYKIAVKGTAVYFEAQEVEDPITKKLLEELKKLEYRCRQDNPLITQSSSFSAENSQRVSV